MNNPNGCDRRPVAKALASLPVALGLAMSMALGGCASQPHGVAALPPPPVAEQAPAPPAATQSLTPAQIAKMATPSVVTIRGNGAMGTGFIVRHNGWIATNFHVIARQKALTVTI